MRRLSIGLLVCGVTVLMNFTSAYAQNYFTGGDFEAPVMPHVGDNVLQMPAPWVASTQYSQSAQAHVFSPLSIVRVEGPNGTVPTADPTMPGGNALLQALPLSDASNTPTGQYARSTQSSSQGSRHGQRIELPNDGCVKFSGKFSNGNASNTPFGIAVFEQSPSFLANLQNNPLMNYFDPYLGQNSSGNSVSEFLYLDTGDVWNEHAVRLPVTANETYSFALMLVSGVAVDDLIVEYVALEQCDPNWTPLSFDPTEVTLEKTCAAPVSAMHNGELGQMWNCQALVTVPEAPFAGTLEVTDVFTPTSTTASEIVSATSASGNFGCVSGATCSIAGADFDAGGTEVLDYSVFVSSTALQDDYPMQNCVQGSYDDAAGGVTPLPGNCVSAQWVPRTSITKTCDPVVAVTSGPMTLNCQIEVTGTDLTSSSFVMAGDAFAALPPMTATIAGSMMNVTSTEPWSCADANLNAPGSIGLCELSAVDMFAAGGTSTINVSFQFTTDQNSGQVANCPMTDILPTSYIDTLGMRSSQLPMRSPQSNATAGLPDNCVILELPQSQVTPKLESVEIKKICDTPELATVQGALGYTWDCRAEITVTPTPFAGTFTFDDDASNISIGSAQFVSVSEPNCTGLTTDHLQCQLDGTTMTAPHVVTYQLFTEVVDPNQPIEWKNCVEGSAVTSAGVYPSDMQCVDTVIKPDVPTDPDAKEITIEKSCGRAFEETYDGAQGIGWDCEITVTAMPAPFSGVFSFTEDASAVSGSNNATIVDIVQPGNDWTCTPAVPTFVTECTIAGSDFDASGVETLSFHLFAETGDGPVDWRNCVSGVYTAASGKPRDGKGNCQGITWKPDTTPTFSLKKGCRLAGVENDNALYACSIYITQTSGNPISAPLTFDELFSTTSGTPATQYILNLLGTPAMPNGWDCGQSPYTNGASCTISAADFNSNTGHRIDAYLSIPTAVLGKDDYQNCAQVRIGDQVVGTAECVTLEEPDLTTTFDVEKTCKANGERMVMGTNIWVQPYQCTLVVTTNGVPFNGPLWIMEDLHFGQNPGNASIQNITSADPWDCASPPYGPAGQGNTPYCGIQGAQFPASGTSTLTVDIMMNGSMDAFGAENCVEISVGPLTAAGLPAPIASDCFEIAPSPVGGDDPVLEVVKTCEAPTRRPDGKWDVSCEVTVSGANLPPNTPIRVTDDMLHAGPMQVVNSTLSTPGGGAQTGCFGSPVSATGDSSVCYIQTNQVGPDGLGPQGGSYTFGFNGIYSGPGGQLLNGPRAQNCVSAFVQGTNIRAPQGPLGTEKFCVPLDFKLSAISGPIVGAPADPTGPVISTGPAIATGSIGVPNLQIPSATLEKTCEPLVFAPGAQTAEAVCYLHITTQNLVPGQLVKLEDALSIGNAAPTVPIQGPFMTVINSPLWACADAQPAGASAGQCFMTSDGLMSLGPALTVTWTATLPRDNVNQHRGLKNCATLTLGNGTPVTSCVEFEAVYENKAPDTTGNTNAAPTLPVPATSLAIVKTQTSDCMANRKAQTYECGFRLLVTNTGSSPYQGPLLVSDTVGQPGAKSASLLSGAGWSCAGPVGNGLSCTNPMVNLAAGASTHLDLGMRVKARRKGGQVQNCAAVGIPNNRMQRVAAIQHVMNARGLNAGPVDGKPGRKTYAALAKLQTSLGLPVSRDFGDRLFATLGMPLQTAGTESCVVAQLPPMPAPPLQCNLTTTVKSGESCLCRFDKMERRNATSCQCGGGFRLIKGKGCVPEAVPTPEPVPSSSPLSCEKASTRKSGDQCVCLDQKNAKKVSPTQCRCSNGLPMIGGTCLAIEITPLAPRTGTPAPSDDIDAPAKCKIRLNGLCIK